MARPRTHTDEVRGQLVDAAVAAVENDGLGSLALRDLAARAGTSTAAVYSLFGGKEALQRAVLVRAFEEFATVQAAVPVTDDPVEDISGLGVVYVQWALDHPHLYEAMFGRTLAGIAPSTELAEAGERAIAAVTSAVRRAIGSGAFRPAEEATVVTSLWAQVHGVATLMIAGLLPEGADPGTACYAAVEGWRTAPS